MSIGLTRWLLAGALTIGLASASTADTLEYDANCNRTEFSEDQKVQQEICSAHIGCRFVMKVEKICKVKDFLGKIGDFFTGRKTPDNFDVLEALDDDIPQPPAVKAHLSRAKDSLRSSRPQGYDRSNAAQITPETGSLVLGQGGSVSWFEGKSAGTGTLSGQGTIISSTGSITAGNINQGILNGPGLERYPNGEWRGGQFQNGTLQGGGFQTGKDDQGRSFVREGEYRNGKPEGMMTVTWMDYSSRRELWKDGKELIAGDIATRGVTPVDPVFKTPAQIAAEAAQAEEDKFTNYLRSEMSPAALYVVGDEWTEKGNQTRARAAWRELVRRFPNDPFALHAADRLAGKTASSALPPVEPPPGSALPSGGPKIASESGKNYSLEGEWVGDSGNRVTITKTTGGYNMVGTGAAGIFFFRDAGPGRYEYRFADGKIAKLEAIDADTYRITNPDGWTDISRRVGKSKPPVAATTCNMNSSAAVAAFDAEFTQFMAQYPNRGAQQQYGGSRDQYQFSMFFSDRGLKILANYKQCMTPADYQANYNALDNAGKSGKQGCLQTSSDGGASCIAEYPPNWRY